MLSIFFFLFFSYLLPSIFVDSIVAVLFAAVYVNSITDPLAKWVES